MQIFIKTLATLTPVNQPKIDSLFHENSRILIKFAKFTNLAEKLSASKVANRNQEKRHLKLKETHCFTLLCNWRIKYKKDLRDWVGYHAETAFSRYFRIFYGYPTSGKTTKPKLIVLLTKVTGPKNFYSLLADINTKTCFTNDLGQNS